MSKEGLMTNAPRIRHSGIPAFFTHSLITSLLIAEEGR